MTRHIALFAVIDGQIRHITYQAAQVLGESVRDYYYTPGIIQHGAGMDMVWNLIYNLSHALYGDHRIRDEKL